MATAHAVSAFYSHPVKQTCYRTSNLDPLGRVRIGPSLTLSGHPEIFVIGDMAHCLDSEGKQLPGVAPVAIQQGQYAAQSIRKRLAGKEMTPFAYKN